MNILERLHADLQRCRDDAERAYERAPVIAATYIQRRLDQLDSRFRRHAWGWSMPDSWSSGLQVIPAVWGEHDANKVAQQGLWKLGQRDAYLGIKRIIGDIDTLGKRIEYEFGRPVDDVLSARAKAWGVDLGALCPDPVINRQRRVDAYGASASDLADVAGRKGIWPIHRSGGCGYF